MKIVAVGGGEIGRPGTKIETLSIDRKILSLTGKKHPRLLFVPTASGDSEGYIQVVEKYFGRKLGCSVDTLLLLKDRPSTADIRKKIMSADILYVGGGNTLRMIRQWRKLGVDQLLKEAADKGAILAGVSAGAICWFRYGHSDSQKMNNASASYIRVQGLGFHPLFLVPHFDKERARQESLKKMLKGKRQVAIALENCSAIEIVDDSYRILTSHPKASAYRCYWKDGIYFKETLASTKPSPLSELQY